MKVGIIGAGASGLMLASELDHKGIEYMIFNAGKVGRKILASGNGRCNISHNGFKPSDYFSNTLATSVVENNIHDVFDAFRRLHIYTKCDEEGRMYPISESSQSVLNVLLKSIHQKITDLEITSIDIHNGLYYFNNCYGPFDKVVIATGSIASFKRPYLSMKFLDSLNLEFHDFAPSLVGFTTMKKIRSMSGARAKCSAALIQNHKVLYEEEGEVIFKDNGISGIVIMNLSAHYQHLKNHQDVAVRIDFAKGKDYPDYETVIQPKILEYIKENHLEPHNFLIPVSGVYDFEFAQVCRGGIDICELNDNLSLKKNPDVFASGEIIDVDGVCGGYNLLFAFSSALCIAKELHHEISGK